MAIQLLKLQVDHVDVNLPAGDNMKPEFLEKNQMHTIPLLEDGDVSLADSHAIITYLVSKYGAEKRAELYPNDVAIRSKVDEKMYFDTSILFPRLRGVVESFKVAKATGPSADQAAKIEEAYGFVDKYLQKTKYIAADHLTVADLSCVASISTLNCVLPINKKYEKVHEWLQRIQENDWYQKGNVPGLTNFDNFIKYLAKLNA